ncbi:cyclin-like protein [Lentinula edodes]|nr:cyclin-like protein [Lentinula edodes]KAH7878081.1 cyclin-like protein [Lentinula edodes]KAJ3903578.1 cyclin-like protein [Lentinula edodes]KAJ3918515.1 cyclin-like protein [Lentinula edodes]
MEGTYSPSQLPASSIKYHHSYFTPAEVEIMSEKQRGKMTVTQEDKIRQNACGFIDAIGSRIGFPRRTIATGQSLYHRFHLFFPRKDFNFHDVALAALYVSTKMHDTLKKPRELLAASYAIRFPDLLSKSKSPFGEVDIDTVDPQLVEHDRQRLLAVERLILETICFNFTSRMPFSYVIKMGRALGASKKLTKLAWRLAIDSHRTFIPIEYPPHTVALGSIYVAAILGSFEQPEGEERQENLKLAGSLGQRGDWEQQFQAHLEDLEAIAHVMVDLLIQRAQTTANTSPATPSSPSPHPSPRNAYLSSIQSNPTNPFNTDQLIRLKIAMRESDHDPRPRESWQDPDSASAVGREVIGRNEGTVRFLFEPPGFAGRS